MISKNRQAALGFIFITAFLDVLSFGVIIPVGPKLIESFTRDSSQTLLYVGRFATLWALMQFIFSPVMGVLSDRFGRRVVLLASCLGMGLDFVLMALAPNLTWLLIGRVISGITASSFSTAGAYIADITPPEKRAASFGILGGAFGLGFVMGPALGGILGSIDLRLPFWVAAGLSLANFVYGYRILPESLPLDRRSHWSWRKANPVGSLLMLGSISGLLPLAFLGFLYQMAHQVLNSVYVYYCDQRFGWTPRTVGVSLALVGICSIIVQATLVRPLVKRFGEVRMLLFALTCGTAGFFVMGRAPNDTWIWMGIPILAGMGFFMPSLQGLMTQRVAPHNQGKLQGANGSIMGITGILGPPIFTRVYDLALQERDWFRAPGAPFYLASAMLVLAAIVALVMARRRSIGRESTST